MIKLPKLFENILGNSPTLHAAVTQSFDLFEPWLTQSGMPFFPGFTDHSPRHISDVLNTSASLISDASHELLTAEDVAALCIAALLHDCGMHLTQDCFRALIGNSTTPIISGFNDQSWSQLWKEYLAEARRFGQDKLIAIFGDVEPIRVDEINIGNLSERDFLLIGEFVRRHHARLAHEIAIAGVPAGTANKLELTGFSNDLRDIAGVIARSHGMPIRSTFSYLEERYSLVPEQRRVKGPFLMAVLRISDYIQVQSERALRSLLSVKELRSPISRQEWRNHFAVNNVSQWHDDPESFFVDAAPTDAKTYLRLVGLFADIQRELDESWATIGEVYGRRGALAKLGLTMRRIRSNLDEAGKFAKTVSYFPIKAGFDSSGPDLLKLLVGPLYDYKHEVGIRELVQNAVDACRERSDFTSGSGSTDASVDTTADVTVTIEENDDGTGWITVTDRGVGMTLDTVIKYYLIAGASFRDSDLWKQQHLDELGQSRVMRGGRFGVGALAAFLLGDEIQVKTRHFSKSDSDGIEFRARIDDPTIELRRCMAPAGTTIKIWVSNPKIIDSLRPIFREAKDTGADIPVFDEWRKVDWFIQPFPLVEYRWNGYSHRLGLGGSRIRYQAKYLPIADTYVPIAGAECVGWNRLPDATPYKDIFWKYVPPVKDSIGNSSWYVQPADEVSVNGIRVQPIPRYGSAGHVRLPKKAIGFGVNYEIKRPSLAIFDPAGLCPINLQRSAVAFDRMGIDNALAKEVLKCHVKGIINLGQSSGNLKSFYSAFADFKSFNGVDYEGLISPVFATRDGFGISVLDALQNLALDTVYLCYLPDGEAPSVAISSILEDGEAIFFRHTPTGRQNDLAWFRGAVLENSLDTGYSRDAGFPPIRNSCAVSLMPRAKWEYASQRGKVNRTIIQSLQVLLQDNDYVKLVSGNNHLATTIETRCREFLKLFGGAAEVVGWSVSADQPSSEAVPLLYEVWLAVTGGASLVKYDINRSEGSPNPRRAKKSASKN